MIVRHGQKIIHAHKRDVRKFLKDKGHESAWDEKKKEIEKPVMTNDAKDTGGQNLITKRKAKEPESKEIQVSTKKCAHVKMAAVENNEDETISSNENKNCDLQKKLKMARKPLEHMAFKADGFPCPQLIIIRADSIPLDDFLQIRHLVISQGHYVTSITDRSGKATQEVLQIVEKNRPINVFNRAQRQVDQELTAATTASASATPPRKTLRLTEKCLIHSKEITSRNLLLFSFQGSTAQVGLPL